MPAEFIQRKATALPANVPARHVSVDAVQWTQSAHSLARCDARLLALWGTDDRDRDGTLRIMAAFLLTDHVLVMQHAVPADAPLYPSLAPWFPAAERLQRAVHDLLGMTAHGGDARPWLRHAGWADTCFPLRRDCVATPLPAGQPHAHALVAVDGDGVHEIAVGPVHAGIIEPGHFRFSVVGEKVLRLEARLGYTHKGIAKRFQDMPLDAGHRLAARICGDSTVAYAWAYCAALESISGTNLPRRAALLRALALERERLANHLGDLGALGNDAGLAFGLVQFSSLKEQLLRLNQQVFGQRYLFDYVIPGGVAVDPDQAGLEALRGEATRLQQAISTLRAIYDDHGGLQDRLRETGVLDPVLARTHGALGLVGRASGVARDARIDLPWPPYDRLPPKAICASTGDVAARVQVRFEESIDSLRLCRALLQALTPGPHLTALAASAPDRLGLGLIEGWRGPVMIALQSAAGNRIRHCHAHDPSWQNWPLLEHAIHGNIVPDFPLINKSFNLAYSGHDG